MKDTSANFAQECCELYDFQAIIYCPDTGYSALVDSETLLNYECRTTPSLGCDALLIFEDAYNINDKISANTNLWVHVFYAENGGEVYSRRDFRVLSSKKLTTQNKAALTLELMDTPSYIFSKTFKSGMFKGLGKCLEAYYDEYVFGDSNWKEPTKQLPGGLQGFRCDIGFKDISGHSGDVTIPGNKSFLIAFSEELKRAGCICYLENNTFYIVNAKDLNPENLPSTDIVYSRKETGSENYPNYLYYSKFNEAPKITQKPKTQGISYNWETKKMNLQNTGIELGIDIEEFDNSGVKLEYTENLNEDELYLKKYLSYLDTYTGRLVIPGRKNSIKLFSKIRVEAHNPNAGDTGDIRDSGYFIITGYVEKIMLKNRLVTLVKASRFSN